MSMATGKDMVGALGAEVDRLESEIKRVMPGIRHIDLVRCPRPAGLACCSPMLTQRLGTVCQSCNCK